MGHLSKLIHKGILPLVVLVILPLTSVAKEPAVKTNTPNILFIIVDDLRPELGCYGEAHIKSPNIDRLAKSGMVFDNAYCNYPQCMSSRASLLSGVYPSHKRFTGGASQDGEMPGVVSLPMHFRNNNYQTVSLGKVYHYFDDGKGSWDTKWTPPITTTRVWDYQSKEGIRIFEERNKELQDDLGLRRQGGNLPRRGPAFEKPEVPDIAYEDGRIAKRAVEELQKFQNGSQPFFLAVGFKKPHLPFNAPVKYWDLYDQKDISLPDNYYFPKDAPDRARFNWDELRAYYGIPQKGAVPDTTAYNLIHGYYACVSYVDAQIGLVLNALEYMGLKDNTIVILVGDHGFFLGEHGFWCKQSNFEEGAHTPLIMRVPWKNPGIETEALVEFVDLYPTLCDLSGLDLPFHLQGKSMVPLFDDPGQSWKDAVFCRITGETILTKTHAYTEWINYETGEIRARMLYDRVADPEANINISELPGSSKLIMELHDRLHSHLKKRDRIIP